MIHINKGNPIPEFVECIEKENPENWEAFHKSRKYPNISNLCKQHIFEHEQNMLGGYTERPLSNSISLHIDHFRKKGLNWPSSVAFDWNNFIVEDRNVNFGACYKDDLTKSIDDYRWLLDPVVDYPEQLMDYLANGEIKARSGIAQEYVDKVNFTIDRFNLNHEFLVRKRYDIIQLVLEGYSQFSDEDVKTYMKEQGFPSVVDWALSIRKEIPLSE